MKSKKISIFDRMILIVLCVLCGSMLTETGNAGRSFLSSAVEYENITNIDNCITTVQLQGRWEGSVTFDEINGTNKVSPKGIIFNNKKNSLSILIWTQSLFSCLKKEPVYSGMENKTLNLSETEQELNVFMNIHKFKVKVPSLQCGKDCRILVKRIE